METETLINRISGVQRRLQTAIVTNDTSVSIQTLVVSMSEVLHILSAILTDDAQKSIQPTSTEKKLNIVNKLLKQ